MNLHRRHLDASQRAMALAMIAPEAEKGAPGKRSKILLLYEGAERNAMRVAINKARVVLQHAPTLVGPVISTPRTSMRWRRLKMEQMEREG